LGYILYTTILIARVLDATDQVRTEKLTAAKSVGFFDGHNVEDTANIEQVMRETIVLPVICVLVMGKAIIVLSSGKEVTGGESWG
jgi:hypothetical protein